MQDTDALLQLCTLVSLAHGYELGVESRTYKIPRDKITMRASLTRGLILIFQRMPIGSNAKTRSAIMLHAF
jgi:hypothetical protein